MKRSAFYAVLVLALMGYAGYRFFDPYASFNDLCRSGNPEQVRAALAGGAQSNPELAPFATLHDDYNPSVYVKTTHPDGITTYVLENDDTPHAKVRTTFLAYVLNYPDELPLHAAIRCNPDPEVAVALIRAGARDSDGTLSRAFFLALQRGVDKNAVFVPAKLSALVVDDRAQELKLEPGAARIVEAILAHGEFTLKEVRSSLLLLLAAIHEDSPEIYRILFANPRMAEILASNDSAMFVETPMVWIAKATTHPAVIAMAAATGLDINLLDSNGASPLSYAICYNKAPGIVEALLKAGANPNQYSSEPVRDPSDGRMWPYRSVPPLVLALLYNKEAEAMAMLEAGADPLLEVSAEERERSERDERHLGRTTFSYILDFALGHGNERMVQRALDAMSASTPEQRTLLMMECLIFHSDPEAVAIAKGFHAQGTKADLMQGH